MSYTNDDDRMDHPREHSSDLHHNRSSDTVPHDPITDDRSIEVPVKEFKKMPTNSSHSQIENSQDSIGRQRIKTPVQDFNFYGLKTTVFASPHNHLAEDSLRMSARNQTTTNLETLEISQPKKADAAVARLEGRRGARDRKQANKSKPADEQTRRLVEDSLMKYEKEVDLMHREEVLGRNEEPM